MRWGGGEMGANVLAVIPARFGATRLPGKPLLPLLGRPMIEWVYGAARRAVPDVVVATDDRRIERAVRGFGGRVVMTPASCRSGTDRMAIVARRIPARIYVNIQGDEPLMAPSAVRRAVALAREHEAIGTVATRLPVTEQSDPSAVKVVIARDGRALYFSRSAIPHAGHGSAGTATMWKHIGLYAFPKKLLARFVALRPPALEKTERLEQLRALYYGLPVVVACGAWDAIGVDTRADLRRAEEALRRRARKGGRWA